MAEERIKTAQRERERKREREREESDRERKAERERERKRQRVTRNERASDGKKNGGVKTKRFVQAPCASKKRLHFKKQASRLDGVLRFKKPCFWPRRGAYF